MVFLNSVFTEVILESFVFKLMVASLFGAAIGFERDIHGRAAGLRTHLLVSLGAAVFMILSEYIAVSYADDAEHMLIRTDPTRIAAQIITGIGFLGAGAIIKSGLTVHGLTTSACLWLSAAIGMSVGAGYYQVGITTTLIGLFALIVLNKIEKVYSKDSYRMLEITASNDTDISKLIDTVKRKYLKILHMDMDRNYNENRMVLNFSIRLRHKDATDKLAHEFVEDLENSDLKIYSIKWERK